MANRRFITVASATFGTVALMLGSAMGGHAQVPPPGTINTPSQVSVPPESTLPLSDVLAFTGQATIQSDNCTGVVPVDLDCPPVGGGEGDNPPAVDLIGGGGTFGFTSGSPAGPGCVGWSDTAEAGLCSVGATGSFQNAVCGTGYVQGTVTITGGADAGESGPFGIVFAATVGVVTGNISDTPDADGSGTDYVVGVVQLGPPLTTAVPALPDCTSGFTVTSVDVALDL
jgi:hypothetical protein